MSDGKRLTTKREAFIAAYVQTFNATAAAKEAGYASPAAEGHRLLKDAEIKARVNAHLDAIRQEGIGQRAVRIAALNDLYDDLRTVQRTRGEEARQRGERGDNVPHGAETGLLVETKKQIGTGPNAIVETEWSLDKSLVKSIHDNLEQVARETGDRDRRLHEVTGPDGGPLQVETAKQRLLDLIGDDDESES